MSLPNRMLPEEEAQRILAEGRWGVLSTASAAGEPYAVPINYVWMPEERCLLFHCATEGKKLQNLGENPRFSLAVVGAERLVPERYTTHYESALAEGHAQLVEEEAERRALLTRLAEHFSPGNPRQSEVVEAFLPRTALVKLHVERLTAKRNRDE